MSSFGFDSIGAPPKVRPESLLLFKLKRQRSLIVLLAIPFFLCLAIGVQLLPPIYKARSQVTVESRTPRPPVRGSDVEVPEPFTEDVIGTEMAVLSSRELMSEVVTKLRLNEDPYYNPFIAPGQFQRFKQQISNFIAELAPSDLNPNQYGADREWSDTVDALTRSVKFTPLPRSRVIEITTSARDSRLAAEISNLIADLYITTHLTLTREMNADASKFLTRRLAELQTSATAAAEAVESYRLQAGLSSGATSTLMQEQISQVERQLLDARARQDALQTQYDNAKNKNPEQLSISVNSPTMTRLRDFEALTSAKAAEITSRFGPQSPQLTSYASSLANVRAQIAAEARRAVQGLKTDLDSANANVASLAIRANDLRKQLGRMDEGRAHLETLQAQSAAAYSLYNAFLNRSKETDASLLFPSTDVRLVSRATVPAHAAFPQNLYMLPASAFVSLGLASLIGLLIENRRKGIFSSAEIEALFGLPTLGMIPVYDPKLPNIYRDAYEHLLNRIYFGLRGKRILITSAFPDEGKTTTARALAEAASARGLRVILVDGDLRSIDQAPAIGNAASGFAEVLRGDVHAEQAVELAPQSSLAILPSGRTRDNPIRLLSLPNAHDVFERLSYEFDLVIIDGPPVMVGGDCWMLSQHVDRTIMVVKWGATSPSAVSTALKQLTPPQYEGGPPANTVSGIVLNMVDRSMSRKLDNADSAMFAPSVYRYHQQGR